MSAIANIVAFDGAATPVTHTLVPMGITVAPDGSRVASWKESLSGVPDYAQITFSASMKKMSSGVFRLVARTSVPVMEAVNAQNSSGYTAPPKVAFTDTNENVTYAHERSVVTGRRLCRQLHINILGNVAISVVPITTGPVPEMVDQLIMPT